LNCKLKLANTQTKKLKELDLPKMKILSVFTHPHVVPNLYVFICFAEHKGRYLDEHKGRYLEESHSPLTIVGKNTYYGSQWGMISV